MLQHHLFADEEGPDHDLDQLVAEATSTMRALLVSHVLCIAWSGGKDSTACLILAILALKQAIAAGANPAPLIVLHGSTLVENPSVEWYAHRALDNLRTWAATENLPIEIITYAPDLAASFAVNNLSGSQLPIWQNHAARLCSHKWKLDPAAKAYRTAIPRLRDRYSSLLTASHPVTVVGSRLDESTARAANMEHFGLRHDQPIVTPDGRHLIAPIAHWSSDDVWTLLATAGLTRQYQVWQATFDSTIALYRDAGGACVVVPGAHTHARTACGARTGCHPCTSVMTDKSLTLMTADPRYHHLRPLLDIRNFLDRIQYDWHRRSWVSRESTTRDGVTYVKLTPDSLSAETLLLLIQAYMTADRDEANRAAAFAAALEAGRDPDDPYVASCRRLGTAPDPAYLDQMQHPQFCTLSPRQVVALDFYSTVQLKHSRPFTVLEAHYQIYTLGRSITVPDLPAKRPRPLPPTRWYPLPADSQRYPGLSEPLIAGLLVDPDTPCALDMLHLADDGEHIAAMTSTAFDVHAEAADLILALVYPNDWRARHHAGDEPPTAALRDYLQLGAVSLSGTGRHRLHAIVQRRERIHRAGLYAMSIDQLLAGSVDFDRTSAATPISLFPDLAR